MVIVGLDEMKSVMIFSDKPDEIADELMHTIGLGLTFIKGQGGYTGEDRKIVYLIAERLQLSEVKALVQTKDPDAFIPAAVDGTLRVLNAASKNNRMSARCHARHQRVDSHRAKSEIYPITFALWF